MFVVFRKKTWNIPIESFLSCGFFKDTFPNVFNTSTVYLNDVQLEYFDELLNFLSNPSKPFVVTNLEKFLRVGIYYICYGFVEAVMKNYGSRLTVQTLKTLSVSTLQKIHIYIPYNLLKFSEEQLKTWLAINGMEKQTHYVTVYSANGNEYASINIENGSFTPYLNGRKNGWFYHVVNGKIVIKGFFLNDKNYGQWIFYHPDGVNIEEILNFDTQGNLIESYKSQATPLETKDLSMLKI